MRPLAGGPIIIAGGGIGGLATAVSLHQAGFDVDVHESVERIGALGVGINLLPHAMRELSDAPRRGRHVHA